MLAASSASRCARIEAAFFSLFLATRFFFAPDSDIFVRRSDRVDFGLSARPRLAARARSSSVGSVVNATMVSPSSRTFVSMSSPIK